MTRYRVDFKEFAADTRAGEPQDPLTCIAFFEREFGRNQCRTWKHTITKGVRYEFAYPADNPAFTVKFEWPFGALTVFFDQRDDFNDYPVRNPDAETVRFDAQTHPALIEFLLQKMHLEQRWIRMVNAAKVQANPELAAKRARRKQVEEDARIFAAVNQKPAQKKKVLRAAR